MFVVVVSFLFFLAIFAAVGIFSIKFRRKETSDYLLAGRSVNPILVALSAVATCWSGFMFVGMIGAAYVAGVSSVWVLVGFVVGDYLVFNTLHKKIRDYSEENDVYSLSGLISNGSDKTYKVLRIVAGVLTIAFLGGYAAGQLTAGSKALHVLFGWNYNVGAIIGAFIVLLYCYAGGIRASIWTDVAQSFVMMLAMGILFVVALVELGGFQSFFEQLRTIDPTLLNLFPENLKFGVLLFIIGMIFLGIGTVGQPHIMTRFMAINNSKNIRKARKYYFGWTLLFCFVTIFVGIFARVLIPIDSFDAELALPALSMQLLPNVLIGVILAGLFAGTMSTADSQILSCSTSLTNDIFPKMSKNYLFTKMSTVIVTLIVLLIALFGTKNVYHLVLLSWTLLAVSFSPLVTIIIFNQKPSELLSIIMIVLGIIALLVWRQIGYNDAIHEVLPGMLASFAVFFIGKAFGMNKTKTFLYHK
ncbi:sodium/proline symporter [Pseudomonadota bacterium]